MSLLGCKETMDEAIKDIAKYKKKIEKIQEKIKELENIRELCEKKLSENPKTKSKRNDKTDLKKLERIAWKVLDAYRQARSHTYTADNSPAEIAQPYIRHIITLLEPIYEKIKHLLGKTKIPYEPLDDGEAEKITGIGYNRDNHTMYFTKKDWDTRGEQFVKELEQELSTF